MAENPIVGTLIVLLGGWRGTGRRTRGVLALGLAFLLVGFNLMAFASK